MEKQIEPGCLALIVGGVSASNNLGRTVKVVRGLAPGHMIGYDGYHVENTSNIFSWVVEADGLMARRADGIMVELTWALYRQNHLRRIDDFNPEADDLELYNQQGQLEKPSQCPKKQSKFSTRA